jgi:hypothetical protein
MAGFAGFIAFDAWRSLGGILFAKANHLSMQYMGIGSLSHSVRAHLLDSGNVLPQRSTLLGRQQAPQAADAR